MSLTNRFGFRVSWAAAAVGAALGLAIAGGASARAGTVYWDGSSDGSWATIANWSTVIGGGSTPGAVPGSSDDVVFDANAVTNQIASLGANEWANSLSFNNNIGSDITIASGNTLTVGNSGLFVAAPSHVVTLGGTVNVGSSSATTTSMVASGNSELKITGTTGITTNSSTTALTVGSGSGTPTLLIDGGTLNLSGGGYSLTVGDDVLSGPSGAVIQENNAIVTTSGNVGLGYRFTDVGTYAISSGALNVGGGLVVGRNASGANAFTQTGGTVSVARVGTNNGLLLGNSSGTGTYNMQGGNLYAANIDRGDATCTATFNLQGGTIAPYTGTNMTIGSSASASNIVLTLTGNGGTISAIDSGSVARTVNVYSKITGGYGLAFTGAGGTIDLLTANDYTGTTTVSAGTLQLGDGTSGHDGSIAGSSIVNNAALVYNLYGNQTYSGAISGSGYLTKLGAGTLTLSGSNTVGSSSLATTSLVGGGSGELKITGTTGITTNSSTTALSVGSGSGTPTLRINGGTLNLSGGGYSLTVGDYTRSGPSGAVIQENNAIVTTSGSVGLGYTGTDVGTYAISSGALNIGAGLVVGRNSSGANAFTQTGGTVSIARVGAGSGLLLGNVGGTGTYNMQGGNLYAANIDRGDATCTATFNFQGGAIAPYTGNNMTIGSSASASNIVLTLTGSGGTISAIDSGSAARTVNVYAKITGGYGLTFTGAGGTIDLLTANDYTGTTTVSAGTLQLGDGTSGHDGSIAGASIVNNAALVYNLYGNQTYSGAISGNGYLTKLGAGTLTLSGNNTVGSSSLATTSLVGGGSGELKITGTTGITTNSSTTALSVGSTLGTPTLRINGGTLNLSGGGYTLTVGDNTRSGPSGAVIQENGATVTTSGNVGLGYQGSDVGTYTISSGALNVGGGLVVGRNSTGANVFTQTGGTVSVARVGPGNGLLFGNEGGTGTYNMQGGNLYAANIDKGTADCIATFNLQGGTIAPYAGNGMTIGCSAPSLYDNNIDLTLTGNGGTISAIDSGSVARTVNVYAKITGGYGLTFTGAGGTINLLAANDYTGATTVAGGLLNVDGSLANTSSVSVANSATLGGVGSIAGAVSLASGAILAPGDAGVGTLTLSNTLSLSAGALFTFDLATTSASDKVSMTSGALTLNGQQLSDFTFNTLAGFGVGTYTLIDAGSVSGSLGANVSGTLDGLAATLAVSGHDLVLNVMAVPEPSGLVLLAVGLLGLLVYAWRKRR